MGTSSIEWIWLLVWDEPSVTVTFPSSSSSPSSQLPIYQVTIDPWFQIYRELEDEGLGGSLIFPRNWRKKAPPRASHCMMEGV